MSEPDTDTPDTPAKPDKTALIHLYRAEIGRMTAYRVRLDTTTNWAIGMNAAVLSVAFGRPGLRSVLFPLAIALTLMFLWLEARRHRGYELIRNRVRLLEVGFFADQFGRAPQAGWAEELADSLVSPRPGITRLQAVSVRLRRGYLWLLLIDCASWLYSLYEIGEGVSGARLGALPGWLVVGVITALILASIVAAFAHIEPEEG